MTPTHHAKAVVVQCMDFRFVSGIGMFLKKLGYHKRYDLVSLAGSVKSLTDPYDPTDTKLLYRQILLSKKLHDVRDVILINHLDCGAYGGNRTFASPEEENARHVKDLVRAKEMVEHHFPDKGFNVIPVLAKLNADGSVDFKRIKA